MSNESILVPLTRDQGPGHREAVREFLRQMGHRGMDCLSIRERSRIAHGDRGVRAVAVGCQPCLAARPARTAPSHVPATRSAEARSSPRIRSATAAPSVVLTCRASGRRDCLGELFATDTASLVAGELDRQLAA